MNAEARAFVERIGRVTSRGAGRGAAVPPVISDAVVRQIGFDADLIATFTGRAREAGVSVDVIASADRLRWVCGGVGDGAVLVDPTLPDAEAVAGAIGGRARVAAGPVDDAALFGAGAAVVSAQAGVAETGSLVFTSLPGRMRCLTLVPPRLAVLLDAAAIVADLADLFVALTGREGDAGADDTSMALLGNVNVVTGPSKTADIEGIPITGVHGPGEVRIGLVI